MRTSHTKGNESYVVAIFSWSCVLMYLIISASLSMSPWIPRSSGLLAALFWTRPTNGIASMVLPGCLIASVVAPQPVMPLLNTQLVGTSDIQSER